MPANTSIAGSERPAAIDIRFGQIGLIQVQLRSLDPQEIFEDLAARIAVVPRFFERMAVGLDLSALSELPSTGEIRAVVEAVRRAGLTSLGLVSGDGIDSLAAALHMPVLGSLQTRAPSLVPPPQAGRMASVRDTVTAPPTGAREVAIAGKDLPLFHNRPVRSGQRLYARNRDLVITANVGSGAEVIADGCVHVYGHLRGRALAGARGERGARIFCHSFHAELISIAGIYRVFEPGPHDLEGQPVQVWLAKDNLLMARIGLPPLPAGPAPDPSRKT